MSAKDYFKRVSVSGDVLDYFLIKSKLENRTFGQQLTHELSLVMKKEQGGENAA